MAAFRHGRFVEQLAFVQFRPLIMLYFLAYHGKAIIEIDPQKNSIIDGIRINFCMSDDGGNRRQSKVKEAALRVLR
ncbi:hypothetical protein JR316_0010874 [Psilocybe cubensis]|uniref:Uncharacterized protein n=1 Tax=Psilocybe cubensis TaxID=181762 RepID=A0ACB8GMM3_PSICU|nr:hypothetical protein JR316_0010874 [Psilocybe cubensis]KAH9476958.1 hypothetical protein JR316_0010874 [Psilocybe cubensis]